MKTPNYNLLVYTVRSILDDRDKCESDITSEVVQVYRDLMTKYWDHKEIIYNWFASLSSEQLNRIGITPFKTEIGKDYIREGFKIPHLGKWFLVVHRVDDRFTIEYRSGILIGTI